MGWVSRNADGSMARATLWQGSAGNLIDFRALLPGPWNRSSAIDVRVEAGVVRILGTVGQIVKGPSRCEEGRAGRRLGGGAGVKDRA